jgi:hypothetical protein
VINSNILESIVKGDLFYLKKAINPTLFSWNELEKLLNLRPFVNDRRFHIVNDTNYKWMNYWWSSDNSFPPSLIESEMKKYVCYISDASKANEHINRICKSIEDYTGCEVDAHLYFTLCCDDTEIDKFIHKDKSNNLIVQIDGRTNFKVWDNSSRENLKDPVLDIIMEPGDMLFIPRNIWHGALSLSNRLSVSFPISPNKTKNKEDRHWIKFNK